MAKSTKPKAAPTQPIGRAFGTEEDYESLRIDDHKSLYWNGKKLRTEGWSRMEKIALAGVAVPLLLALGAGIGKENFIKFSCDTIGWPCPKGKSPPDSNNQINLPPDSEPAQQ